MQQSHRCKASGVPWHPMRLAARAGRCWAIRPKGIESTGQSQVFRNSLQSTVEKSSSKKHETREFT